MIVSYLVAVWCAGNYARTGEDGGDGGEYMG